MGERIPKRRWRPLLWLGLALAALTAVAAIVARWWRRRPIEERPALPEMPPGLTQEEAAARWSEGQDNAVHLKPSRTKKQIWRENILSIFNLNLVVLAFTQALLGRWLDALLSLGTIALNVGLNVGQEMLVKRMLAALRQQMEPKATVIRDGKARSIDTSHVVRGDVLIVGPGDQLPVDGQVVGAGRVTVDASVVSGKRGWQTMRAGDPVYAGSICVSGRGACLVQKVGDERLIISRMAGMPAMTTKLTPLERVIQRTLRILWVLIALLAILAIVVVIGPDSGLPDDQLSWIASMIFGLAPAGLFLGIIVNYTMGTADLARLGALVRRARSVESLAEATVICFAEAGILTGTLMELKPAQGPAAPEAEPLPESRLRQILGDYARSTTAPSLVTHVLAESFEGSRRSVRDEAPFLGALGWSALTFDEQDLRGVYVLGEPQILEGHMVVAAQDSAQVSEERKSQSPGLVTRLVSPLRRLLKRTRSDVKALPSSDAKGMPDKTLEQAPAAQPVRSDEAVEQALPAQAVSLDEAVEKSPPAQPVPLDKAADGVEPAEDGQQRVPFFRRMAGRVGHALRRARPGPEQPKGPEPAAGQESVLLFAYHPEPVPLHDAEGNVRLPEGLIPLCQLSYTQRLRPEAVDMVRSLATTGVRIKVFSEDKPDQIVAMLQQAGPAQEADRLLSVGIVSGRDLEQLSPQTGDGAPHADWVRAAAEHTIFAQVTPAQAGALVRALRRSGELVAVVGDGVRDLPALQQADLAIARQTSTQAVRSLADIVLMGSSPQVLLQILYRGQGIVHGLLDVLKLNLTQVSYVALLLAVSGLLHIPFPYAPAHGAVIVVAAVALPSIGLALWAAPGLVHRTSHGRILTRSVAPAAVTTALTALIVYSYFVDKTGQVDYAQLTVAYTLIYAGLLLAVLLKPPRLSWRVDRGRPARGGGHSLTPPPALRRKREWRMVGMALVLGIAVFFLPAIPAAQEYLDMYWLQQPADYAVVGLAVVAWAVILSIIWRVIPPVPSGE